MYKFLNKTILIVVSILVCSSCDNRKKLLYFQGTISNNELNRTFTPVFKIDDILSIVITGLDADAVKPFNLPVTNINTNVGGYNSGTPSPPGYLIDSDGNVDFPVIGKIKLAGLTRNEAIDLLKNQLKPYLSNPNIQMRILNFKVTVLGEVRNPGTFTIPNERITLLEALGVAGDLLITGVRNNILVIRDVEGKKTGFRVDLTSQTFFASPVYYLNQNDLVYVEPNKAKANSAIVNPSNISLIISVVSIFITIAVLIKK